MPTRNVVLTDHQATLVERLVNSGRYQNASEVLREGLRIIERRELEDSARLKTLRESARVGLADLKTGRFLTFDQPEKLLRHLGGIVDDTLLTAGTRARRK